MLGLGLYHMDRHCFQILYYTQKRGGSLGDLFLIIWQWCIFGLGTLPPYKNLCGRQRWLLLPSGSSYDYIPISNIVACRIYSSSYKRTLFGLNLTS